MGKAAKSGVEMCAVNVCVRTVGQVKATIKRVTGNNGAWRGVNNRGTGTGKEINKVTNVAVVR